MTRETKRPAPGVDRDGAVKKTVHQTSEQPFSPSSPCESQLSLQGRPAGRPGRTEVHSAAQARKREPEEIIALLAARFPDCFFIDESERVPLKCGIFADLRGVLGEHVSPEALSAALRQYTSNAGYRRRCVRGAPRFNLAGEPDGCVSAEEAVYARAEVKNAKYSPAGDATRLGRRR